MSKYIFGSLLLLISSSTFAQFQLEALKKSLDTLSGQPLVNAQQQLASRLVYSNAVEADSIIRKSIDLSRDLFYKRGEAMGLAILGGFIGNNGEFYVAEETIKSAISIAKLNDDARVQAAAYINLGALYLANDLEKLAVQQHILGAEIASRDSTLIDFEITHLQNLGIANSTLGNKPEAKRYFEEALEKSEKRKTEFRTAQIYGNLATFETTNDNYGVATHYYNKALKIFETARAVPQAAIIHSALARCHLQLDQLKKAKYHIDLANDFFSKVQDQRQLGRIFYRYGQYYFKQADYDKALSNLTESKALITALASDSDLLEVYELMKDVYVRQNNYRKASEISDLMIELKDSIHARDVKTSILKLTNEFDYDRLTKENEAKLEIKNLEIRVRNTYLIALFCLLLVVIVIFLWNRNRLKMRIMAHEVHLKAGKDQIIQQAQAHQEEKKYLIEITNELIQKNSYLSVNLEKLQSLNKNNEHKAVTNELIQKIRSSLSDDKDWLAFNLYFDELYPNYHTQLRSDYNTKFTQYEQRLLALIKIELTNKEIGTILAIQRESVVKAKVRLKEKLGFEDLSEMENYLLNL